MIWFFLGEYQGEGRYAYMSRDQGQTWTTIFDRLAVGSQGTAAYQHHIHDIHYDPYTSMVWIVCGDGGWAQTFYSYNFGTTWHQLYQTPPGESTFLGVQATPDYVIFGTDSEPNGIAVIKKPSLLTRDGGEFTSDMVEYRFIDEGNGLRGLFHSFRYWDGAWYAVSTNTDMAVNPVIVGSYDGYNWYEIYRHDRVASGGGFMTFFRYKDYIQAYISDASGKLDKLIRIEMPKWVE